MGRFRAVGVGPGDPELLTVKAVNAVRAAQVIYHAGPQPDRGRAWDIVRHLATPGQQVRVLFRATMHEASTQEDGAAYRPAVEQIAADCRGGLEVVLITEGDPTLYSTASHVWQLLARLYPDVPVEVVPGVSSMAAAAARLRWPLARHEEMLAVLPGSYRAADLPEVLDRFESVCLLKAPQALAAAAGLLADRPDCEAAYVENVTTATEWVTHDLEAARGRNQYFALVLVRRLGPASGGGGAPPPPPARRHRPSASSGSSASGQGTPAYSLRRRRRRCGTRRSSSAMTLTWLR